MAKPSRYDKAEADKLKQKRNDVKNNPGGENNVPALRGRIEALEQAIGLRPIP